MTNANTPPVWYWIVSVVAFIWNALGCMNYLMQTLMKDEVIAGLPEDQQAYYENIPSWATAGFAIAVWGGLIGSILLLVKKRSAYLLFVISLLGVLAQNTYWMFLSGMPMDNGQFVLPVTVILFGLALIVFSKGSISRGWIN